MGLASSRLSGTPARSTWGLRTESCQVGTGRGRETVFMVRARVCVCVFKQVKTVSCLSHLYSSSSFFPSSVLKGVGDWTPGCRAAPSPRALGRQSTACSQPRPSRRHLPGVGETQAAARPRSFWSRRSGWAQERALAAGSQVNCRVGTTRGASVSRRQ